ncbi:PAS domain S-box [Desulfosporosinus orientis DSM 765]|uniref:PAS domain S-box n=1 Tax=Desulfosporosinus orientis (strain ATCC 19365 / DSM 765 / NCIMB 8382 / VKM B-1628 / Singapore I) TaxID=768706 RepID=G7WAS2_DESOD|nr:PAS domain S-box protein [Desulfosporosinus orientis]AET67133.1 PAS domain S-box [Desulfosporosinus orientis DSM 765]
MTYVNDAMKYQQIFFVSPAVMIIFDFFNGDIVEVNKAAIDYYGYSYDEFLNMKIFSINIADPLTIFEKLKEVNRSKTFLFKHKLKNGDVRDVEVFAGLIKIEGKTLINSIVIDITDKIRAEHELRVSSERLALVRFTYEMQRRSDFINDLLDGGLTYEEKTSTIAWELDLDFSKPFFCCLVSLHFPSGKKAIKSNAGEDLKQQIGQIIYHLSNNLNYFIWDNRDRIGILCQEGTCQEYWEDSMGAAVKLKELISFMSPDLQISIGISEIHCGIGSIKKSYHEASQAQILALCQEQTGGTIYHHKDMGLFQILTSIYGEESAYEFVDNMIGPLIRYDAEKGTNLRITLEEILQNHNLKDAAEKLYIHYKTLVFRKKRVEKILGVSLDNPDTRLALAAATKLYKIRNIKQSYYPQR